MSVPDPAFDLILVGGGLSAALIAWRLALDRPELRVAVIERDGRLGGKHTWSFFDGDLSEGDRAWLAPATPHRWPEGYDVYFPGLSRSLKTPYNSLTSERLHAVVAPLLGNRLIAGEAVEIAPGHVTLADGRTLRAPGIIDARGPTETPHLDLGWQVFVGRTLRLAQPHGLTRPTIMDATVGQGDAYRFVYLLPFAPHTVMVEDTYYADTPTLDRALIGRRIDAYARSRGWTVEAVVADEQGILPIALGGDIDAFWDEGPPVARTGLAAALFHPTTGYSLPDAVAMARMIAELPDLNSSAMRAATQARSKTLWADRAFYRLLNRMLFRAAEPSQRWRVLRRFYGLSEGVVRRFYAGHSTTLDKARILAGKPPVPIGKAMRQLRDTHAGAAL
ncbi:lycopene beta-cyclase CrtY [Brevundimonas sp.]|uniref:lycopene beta-cyclase CrtY n=1 Tax=Brevundimonas sp. TaxID=1871086 RepID=UPI001A1FBBDF|nr:lycopene beta-cyclase CrtY [Brevundimonas sp.]MBJ7486493.1 lycopene beta-cyclase CrtY [Brevundimonas sp.]